MVKKWLMFIHVDQESYQYSCLSVYCIHSCKRKKKDEDSSWLAGKTTCQIKSHTVWKKIPKARNLCALYRLCDTASVRAHCGFIEIISNDLNPYQKSLLCVGAGRIWFSGCFCSAPAHSVSLALTVVCMGFLCTGLWKQLWLWFRSQQNAWMVPS